MDWIHDLRHYFEKHGFDVISRFSERLGIGVKNLRLFFIYLSFVSYGIPLLYLVMIFLLRVRNHFKYRKRPSVFDL